MVRITLSEITRNNWKAALKLSVRARQEEFVPTVTESVAEAHIRPHKTETAAPYGLRAGRRMVGFFAYSYDAASDDNYWINGFMLDKDQQGKGYGRAAFAAILAHAAQVFPSCRRIGLTVHPKNDPAMRLYESMGFVRTGETYEGEIVMTRPVTDDERAALPLLARLSGGDPKSVGRSEEVVADVLEDSLLFGVVVRGMTHGDPLVRMRASDAAAKIALVRPGLLAPYTARILNEIAHSEQLEVRWHVAQMLPKLPLDAVTQRQAVRILDRYQRDDSRFLRTFALQALVDLSEHDPHLRRKARSRVEAGLNDDSAAVRARARKLRTRLNKLEAR